MKTNRIQRKHGFNNKKRQMLKDTTKQISFRINTDEVAEINELITQHEISYTTVKDLFFEILRLAKTPNTPVIIEETTIENAETEVENAETEIENAENKTFSVEFSDETKAKISEFSAMAYEVEPSTEQLIIDLIEIATIEAEPQTVEKIVEVEKQLSPGQILVNLSPGENDLLEKIARFRKVKNITAVRETTEQLIKAAVFNKITLSENKLFITGIPSRKINLQ